jgi:hypothetical protein
MEEAPGTQCIGGYVTHSVDKESWVSNFQPLRRIDDQLPSNRQLNHSTERILRLCGREILDNTDAK